MWHAATEYPESNEAAGLGGDVFGRRSQTFGLHHRVDPIFQALGRTLDAFQPEALLHRIGALIHQLIFPGVQPTLALPTRHLRRKERSREAEEFGARRRRK